MKERPILFSGPMVRAILGGHKTVTRRIVKPAWPAAVTEAFPYAGSSEAWMPPVPGDRAKPWEDQIRICPYGKLGDRLWVRESWWQAGENVMTHPEDDEGVWSGSKRIHYSADGLPPNEPNRHYPDGLRNGRLSAADPHRVWRHRPSIHMPRWAGRHLLEITVVRVERLQDISDEQCIAEGIGLTERAGGVPMTQPAGTTVAKALFAGLWNSTGGDWDANPWVWVVEFKQVTP